MNRSSTQTQTWPRAVLADLDGTLVDSATDVADAANQALRRVGLHASSQQIRAWLGDGARALLAKALAEAGQTATDAELGTLTDIFVRSYAAVPCRTTRAFAGVFPALGRLRGCGVAVAVCTNKPESIARTVLEKTGLEPLVDVLTGGGSLPLKPAPDSLLACMQMLAVEPTQVLYIGDHAVDVQAARAAGCPVLLAEFGYSQTPVPQLGPDGVLSHWDALPRAIKALAGSR